MLVEAFLRGLVVVGADLQGGVGAGLLGEGGQLDGLGGGVGAGAGDDGDAAVGGTDDPLDDLLVLFVVEGGRFAGGADGDDAVGAALDLESTSSSRVSKSTSPSLKGVIRATMEPLNILFSRIFCCDCGRGRIARPTVP